jgi:phage-related protein (TIGR01555 family)
LTKPHYRKASDGAVALVTDGLQNVVANLGTGRDKASWSSYVQPVQDDNQLSAMYRGSAIARKIVDMPAEDAMREWREWQAEAAHISAIEAEENRLGLQAKAIKAKARARLFGGAAIYIGTDDQNIEEPLEPKRIKRGGLKYLTVLARHEITPGEIERDPRKAEYGKPRDYRMATDIGDVAIHPSRLVLFEGETLPDDRFAAMAQGWGDSSLTCCIEPVRNLDATMANIASLVFEAKVDVLGVPGLMDKLRDGGQAYESLLLKRATLAATGKGINGMLITDGDETYSQKSANFATLPDIATTFMQMTSAAASIPMTLLFGMSPGGLNASGDADTRGYYDRVKVMQALELQPAMSVLDECLIYSALGNRPAEIFYNWRPLWQPTTKERAETGKTIAETFVAISGLDLLPPEALGKAIVNGLTESGLAPGLEADVAEYFEGGVPDNEEVTI